jgi:hypothetical protein
MQVDTYPTHSAIVSSQLQPGRHLKEKTVPGYAVPRIYLPIIQL